MRGELWLFALALIAIVDWVLGATAEYFNAWSLIEATFGSPRTFMSGQERFGSAALLVGWLVYFAEAALVAAVLRGLLALALAALPAHWLSGR